MRWGWVSRELYEQVKEELRESRREQLEESRRVTELLRGTLERLHERALSAPPSVAMVAAPPASAVLHEPSMVAAAVREQAQGDSRLSAYLWSYVARLRRDNLTDEQIVEALSQWETTEPMEPVSA